MALTKPLTEVYFLQNANVDYQMNNVLWLSSEQAEVDYFLSKAKFHFSNCRAINNDGDNWEVTVPLAEGSTLDDYYNCNYMMWRNPQFSGKWFYAYIGTPRPAAGSSVTVPFEIDQWQTWHWSCVFPETLVRRETVKDDSIGANVVEENIETGEFVIAEQDKQDDPYKIGTDIISLSGWDTTPCVLIVYTYKPKTVEPEESTGQYIINAISDGVNKLTYQLDNIAPAFAGGRVQQGIYQACKFVAFEIKKDATYDEFAASVEVVNKYMQSLVDGVMIQSVQILRMIPKFMAPASGAQPIHSKEPRLQYIVGKESPKNFGGYVPKNNKLFTEQYNYIVLDNGAGTQQTLGYEYFKGDSTTNTSQGTPTFHLYSQLSTTPSCRLIPISYKGPEHAENPMYAMELNTYPQCSYSYNEMRADYFKNRSSYAVEGARSIYNMDMGLAKGITSAVSGGPLGLFNGITTIADTALDAAETIAKQTDRARVPNIVQGVSDSNIQFAIGRLTFTEYRMQVRPYYAKIIDNYFTAYGYAINDIKKPELNTRTRFNFIWTQGANIMGDLPTDAKKVINAQLDAGLRIWHDPEAWLDYGPKNTIKG